MSNKRKPSRIHQAPVNQLSDLAMAINYATHQPPPTPVTYTRLLNQKRHLAYFALIGYSPTGEATVAWSVTDLEDPFATEPFAYGTAVGEDLAVTEAASAARARLNLTREVENALEG